MKFFNACCLGASLSLVCVAVTADYQAGVQAYQDGDYAVALEEFGKLAERGVVVAYTNLGYMHALGEGVEPDMARAAQWFLKAAEAGSGAAQLTLGVLYFHGEGVEVSYVDAYAWFNLAATVGRSDALEYLTLMSQRMDPEQNLKAQALSRALFDRFGQSDPKGIFAQ